MMDLPYDLNARRPYLEPDFSDAEYQRRVQAVLAGMAKEGLDALIVHCGPASYASARLHPEQFQAGGPDPCSGRIRSDRCGEDALPSVSKR